MAPLSQPTVLDWRKLLIDFVPASGTLIDVSRARYDWLQRERMDGFMFERRGELVIGLAYPNEVGTAIRDRLSEADSRSTTMKDKAPLQLRISGYLGRLLAKYPETCYLVSTVAALSKFHNIEKIGAMLSMMLLGTGDYPKGSRLPIQNPERSYRSCDL